MKYKTIIETDDYKNFEFFEDGNGKYIHGIDAGAVNNEWIALYFTECEQYIKTGHWIPVYQGDEIIDYRCSECEFGNTFGKGTIGMNFCPVCGCRMVEPQERSDKG